MTLKCVESSIKPEPTIVDVLSKNGLAECHTDSAKRQEFSFHLLKQKL